MVFIESHQELLGHPKTRKAARMLGMKRVHVIGHLHALWWWSLDYADDGDLSRFEPDVIADASEWEDDPDTFITALVAAGFLDRDTSGALHIHDWMDYAGKLVQRRKSNAQRMRDARAAHVPNTSTARVEMCVATEQNQTEQNQTEPEKIPNAREGAREGFSVVEKRPRKQPATDNQTWALVEDICEIIGVDPSDYGGDKGKQGQCAKRMLAKHSRDKLLDCARWVYASDFHRKNGIDLFVVEREYPKFLSATAGQNGHGHGELSDDDIIMLSGGLVRHD